MGLEEADPVLGEGGLKLKAEIVLLHRLVDDSEDLDFDGDEILGGKFEMG